MLKLTVSVWSIVREMGGIVNMCFGKLGIFERVCRMKSGTPRGGWQIFVALHYTIITLRNIGVNYIITD